MDSKVNHSAKPLIVIVLLGNIGFLHAINFHIVYPLAVIALLAFISLTGFYLLQRLRLIFPIRSKTDTLRTAMPFTTRVHLGSRENRVEWP